MISGSAVGLRTGLPDRNPISTGTGDSDRANFEIVNLETRERQVAHRGGTYGRYVPTEID